MKIEALGAATALSLAAFNPGIAGALPEKPAAVAQAHDIVKTPFTLTERCIGQSLIASVAVTGAMNEGNSATPVTVFDKVHGYKFGLCGDNNELTSNGTVSRDRASGKAVQITLNSTGVRLSGPYFEQTSSANCAPLRASQASLFNSWVKTEPVLKGAKCDIGFIASTGASIDPSDLMVEGIFPAAVRSSKAAITNSAELGQAVKQADRTRLQTLRTYLGKRFGGRSDKPPVIKINSSPNGLKSYQRSQAEIVAQTPVKPSVSISPIGTSAEINNAGFSAKATVRGVEFTTPSSVISIVEEQ